MAQSSLPQPRAAYDMHSARINQIRATPDGTRVLSVSEDKSVRVWRLSDLALLRTLHIPSEPGTEGAIRALAITPDSRAVIVGGWTGLAWSGRGHLYRFDLATGRMTVLPASFPTLIQSLGISRDGRWLAVGLDQGGLRVIDLRNGQEAPDRADPEYAAYVRFTEFGPDGTLATTSQDGCLRLYAPDGQRTFRNQYYPKGPPTPGAVCTGSAMGGVRFSPDGQQIAWGQNERTEVVVMRLADKTLRVIGSDDPQQRSLCCPIFSADGSQLLYHGAFAGTGPTPLFRADLAQPGKPAERLDVGRQRFTNVLPLPNGDVIFSTDAPALVRISPRGEVLARADPPNVDFRFPWQRFRLSNDGTRVAFARAEARAGDWVFSPLGEASLALMPATADSERGLQAPIRETGKLQLQGGLDEFSYLTPRTINGRPLPLQPNQATRSWAAHASLPVVAVGTQWSVLLADEKAQVLWEQALPAPALHVGISADGRWVVAAVGDGTLRWYARTSGQEVLAAFVHQRDPDWVAWRPDGYYASSTRGDQYFGWLVNRGADREPDFFRAVQFERQLYRPDLLAAALATDGSAAQTERAKGLAQVLMAAAVPRVVIESVQQSASGKLQVAVSVEAGSRPVGELGVFVDGLPALTASARAVSIGQGQTLRRVIEVPMLSPGARVRVEAETGQSIGADETLPLQAPAPAPRARGTLHVLAVGITAFPASGGRIRTLRGAAPDAALLADTLRSLGQQRFDAVNVTLVNDTTPEPGFRRTIVDRLRDLQAQVRPEDTVVVFMASHGLTDAGEFYLVTRDAAIADTNRVLLAKEAGKRLAAGEAPSLISGSELTELLRRVPGRRILILDTCHSGAAGNGTDPQVLIKRSASAQVAVMSAASGDEESWESTVVRHGVFTYTLSQALRGALGGTPSTLGEVFDAVAPRVSAEVRARQAEATDPKLKARLRQTPVLTAIPALQATVLVAR